MRKSTVLMAAGVGYVLGARAGHDRYEQIKSVALRVRNDPRVQQTAHLAAERVQETAPVIKDRIADAAAGTARRVRATGDVGDQLNPESTHFQDNPYPQGDLP